MVRARRVPVSGSKRGAIALASSLLLAAACGDDDSTDAGGGTETGQNSQEADDAPTDGNDQQFPDVIDVEVERSGEDTYNFRVTISSPYDTPERYADGWRIVDPEDGTEYDEHKLGHDHADEQPFTRTQQGVEIPEDVTEVTVEGRDLQNGYGGETMTVALPDD